MNELKYIEQLVKFIIQLKMFLKNKSIIRNENNYLYYINMENYIRFKKLLDILNEDEVNFLIIYFDNKMALKEKLKKLDNINKQKYYYYYKQIINKVYKFYVEVKNSERL